MSVTHLSIAEVSAQKINYSYHHDALPILKNGITRELLQSGMLANGLHYSLQLMRLEDAEAIHDILSKAEEKVRDKQYLLPRTLDDVKKTLHYDAQKHEGGFVIGIVVNGNQLAGVVGGEDIDNEFDSGRGVLYQGCPFEKQFCWKMAAIHPEMSGHHLYDLVPAMRMAVTMDMFPQKTCLITKTNNARVKKNYGDTLEWDLKEVYALKQDVVIPMNTYNPAWDNDNLLHTYVTCQENELKKLAFDNAELITRSPVLQHLHERYQTSKRSVIAVA